MIVWLLVFLHPLDLVMSLCFQVSALQSYHEMFESLKDCMVEAASILYPDNKGQLEKGLISLLTLS